MVEGLQQVAESLSVRLGRSVSIDDPKFNLLAYSVHGEHLDPLRTHAILHRTTPQPSRRFLLDHGIMRATGLVRVPGNAELGQLPRLCVPIRNRTILLGYLWVIDDDETITDEEHAALDDGAAVAGRLIHQAHLLTRTNRGREAELVRDLLADAPAAREAAVAELVETGALVAVGEALVVLVQVGESVPADVDLRLLLGESLDRASRRFLPSHSLCFCRGRDGLLIVVDAGASARREIPRAAEVLHEQVAGQLPDTADVRVGIGGRVASVADVATSHRQAAVACRAATVAPSAAGVTAYDQLGVYRLLCSLPPESLTPDVLDDGLRTLLAAGSPMMVETLEAFLDAAGDAGQAAAALQIHRTTMYYRLGRIQEITGADLGDGDRRLAMHLGIRIARFTGLYPGR